ncbi:MAG: hypothetical protein AB7O65_07690 [Candidatus Korobacteraceae bacterium]
MFHKIPFPMSGLLALVLASGLNAWAQRTPAPAASSGPISAIGAADDAEVGLPEADAEILDVPASSIKLPSLGGMPQLFTYGLRVMQVADTNTSQVGRGTSLQSATIISGTTALNRSWGRNGFGLNYNGAESIFAGGGLGTQLASTHQVGVNLSLSRRRWSLNLSEAASYSPQSSFGLGLYGGLGSNPLGFSSGLRGGLTPNDSVLNAGTRINTNTMAEVGYQLGPRNSLRASAGFGKLLFQGDSDFANNDQYNFSFGMDRILSQRSNVSFHYTHFRTTSSAFSSVQTHAVLAGYSRRLTPRMVVQLSAGPQIQTRAAQGLPNTTQWTTSNALLFQMRRSAVNLTYSAGIVGGSGVYGAAENHTVQAALSRPLGRFWGAGFNFGYALNSGVDAFSSIRAQYGGITMSRRAAGAGLSLSYQFQHQSIGGTCTGLACSAFGGWRHTVGLGLDWVFRPVRIG